MADNLMIGKGELWYSPFKAGTKVPEGFFFVGNTPEVSLNREADTLPHYSSTRGLRRKDEEITIEARLAGSFTVDDVRPETVAMFLMGEVLTTTTTVETALTSTFTGVKKGRTYQLGETALLPSGTRGLTAVTSVALSAAPSTVYVANTDYTVDLELGLITILSTGSIADNANITVTYSQAAGTRQRIISGDTEVQGALKWISHNPKGLKLDYLLPWVKIRPNGDLTLVSEEWMTVPLSIEALYRDDNTALAYMDGRPAVA
jgi:hypothetical protein